MRRGRRTSTFGGYENHTLMVYGGFDYRLGRCKSVILGSFPTHPHVAIRDAIRSMSHRRRPFTNRTRDNISRRMQGLEPLSSDSDTDSETEEGKLSEATTTSKTLPLSSLQEQDPQADAPPLKLEDVIPPTQASSSSRNKKRRNKKLVAKTTPPPN